MGFLSFTHLKEKKKKKSSFDCAMQDAFNMDRNSALVSSNLCRRASEAALC